LVVEGEGEGTSEGEERDKEGNQHWCCWSCVPGTTTKIVLKGTFSRKKEDCFACICFLLAMMNGVMQPVNKGIVARKGYRYNFLVVNIIN